MFRPFHHSQVAQGNRRSNTDFNGIPFITKGRSPTELRRSFERVIITKDTFSTKTKGFKYKTLTKRLSVKRSNSWTAYPRHSVHLRCIQHVSVIARVLGTCTIDLVPIYIYACAGMPLSTVLLEAAACVKQPFYLWTTSLDDDGYRIRERFTEEQAHRCSLCLVRLLSLPTLPPRMIHTWVWAAMLRLHMQ